MIELKKLAGMLKDIRFCMMTTHSSDGKMHSRPMAALEIHAEENEEPSIFFFSMKSSFKVKDIENENDVNLTYIDPVRRRYFSLSGKAKIDSNKMTMKELWSPSLLAWFPKGLNDDELVLIKVRIEVAEVWDATPGKLVQEWPRQRGSSHELDYRPH